MESLPKILKRAEPARPVFDFIWKKWLEKEKWPLARAVYEECGKEKVDWAENKLNDAYLMECDPSHDPTYELRLFGVLSSSRGEEWLSLLTAFLEFMRSAYKADPSRQDYFADEEVMKNVGLTKEQTRDLGRLLSFNPFEMMNLGYGSPAFVGWVAGIPKGFYEIGQPGDARKKLEAILVRRYQPRYPVGLRARQNALAEMANRAATIDPWADSIISQTKPSPKSSLPKVRPKGPLDLFISHSSKDRDLAAAMIELLVAALGMKKSRIRCTSVAGTRLPIGVDTDRRIRKEIKSTRVFIGLLTPASLRSPYVLIELGARWLDGGLIAGLCAKGASGSDLVGPITHINVLHAQNEEDLGQFVGDIARALKVKHPAREVYRESIARVCEISRAGDPFVKYEGKRVKSLGQHKRDQYFVHQGITHYVEPDAASVCDKAEVAYISIAPEEEEVLLSNPGEALNNVQMRALLKQSMG